MSVIDHSPTAPAGAVRPTYAPAGPWADLPPFVAPGRPTVDQLEGGRCIWLNDNQIDLTTGEGRVWLTRTVNEIVTPDGLGPTGQVSIDYDPLFETVIFHHVRILRDGVTRVFDPTNYLQLIQRERDLERAKFDGRLTAHFVIPDLRLGDIVDVAWSVAGRHPVLGDHFSADWVFEWGCWVGKTRVRLLAPESRDLRFKPWGTPPAVVERSLPGGVRERSWTSVATPPVRREAETPHWARSLSAVACADAVTWTDAAERFAPLYPADGPLPPELEAEARSIEAAHATSAERAVEALRLVQRSLRYQAVTMGEGGFTPHALGQIWSSRSGDCKDASLLLTALLRRLGVEACPALVNTFSGWTLNEELPSLQVFDHCIVRAAIDGAIYWFDGTNFPQGGTLATLHQPRWGWALPLSAGATLEFMGEDPALEVYEVEERFKLPAEQDGRGELRVTSTHRYWRADWMRRRLSTGQAGIEEEFREYYARRFGGVTIAAPLVVEDDPTANVLRIVEVYALERPLERLEDGLARFQTVDDLFAPGLPAPPRGPRKMPLDVGHPRRHRHEIVLDPSGPLKVSPWNETFTGAGVTATSVYREEPGVEGGSRLVLTLAVERRFLQADEVAGYLDLREKVCTHGGVILTVRPGGAGAAPFAPALVRTEKEGSGFQWWWIVLAVAGLSALARAFGGAGG